MRTTPSRPTFKSEESNKDQKGKKNQWIFKKIFPELENTIFQIERAHLVPTTMGKKTQPTGHTLFPNTKMLQVQQVNVVTRNHELEWLGFPFNYNRSQKTMK